MKKSSSWRLLASMIAALLLFVLGASTPSTAGAAPQGSTSAASASTHTQQADPGQPGMLTIEFGRSAWSAATGQPCTDTAGIVNLGEVAQWLKDNGGISAVGGVVVNRANGICRGFEQTASWDQLGYLRDVFGWTFVSQGMTYANVAEMNSDAAIRRESCDTLPIMAAHGHNKAWGQFNYPNNKQDAQAQRVVTSCFAFGRRYGNGINTQAKSTAMPYPAVTQSINGGRCSNSSLSCHFMPVRNNRYTTELPDIVRLLNPAPGLWYKVQFYKMVEGKSAGGKQPGWDCTSPDWRDRWTGHPENFCFNTFQQAVLQIGSNVRIVSPDVMAGMWGRASKAPPAAGK